jgi:hypothetical protein
MVIERFVRGAKPVYARFAEQGRLMPPGLAYVDSWIDEEMERCFQLMETDDPSLLDEWMARWNDLMSFEVVPVIGSEEAASRALDAGR